MAMAYVDGMLLDDKIAERPLPLAEALRFAIEIAEGLREAHELGIVHRDIKPHNIKLTRRGQVRILDFGLAAVTGGSRLTDSGVILGTPGYMSPEQARGEPCDRRTDIWSLGVVLYEMLAGHRPFGGESDQALLYGILEHKQEPLTAVRTGVPHDVEAVVEKCLRKDQQKRYQTVDDLIVDLRSALDRVGTGRPGSADATAVPPYRRLAGPIAWGWRRLR